ncbi:hypothetical protein K431DRAFT_7313 [Polychaeton citri CBS 116435]|uniref:Uncharacterized protein n=1 Tax=Polychaeton citri CBS 116435 TaxID=1314669 RepID=A0A9P4QH52_9PEZI|nr:hypothetical protein K431DRAFT_7313 [Polychaeton citri CBS 116435]
MCKTGRPWLPMTANLFRSGVSCWRRAVCRVYAAAIMRWHSTRAVPATGPKTIGTMMQRHEQSSVSQICGSSSVLDS